MLNPMRRKKKMLQVSHLQGAALRQFNQSRAEPADLGEASFACAGRCIRSSTTKVRSDLR